MVKRNRFSDPDVDIIIEKIQRQTETNTRDQLIIKANKMVADAAPWVFLWHSKTTYLTQKWIHGFRPTPIFNANRYVNIFKLAPE
jgi:ABC-type transport system substrate-binding protein